MAAALDAEALSSQRGLLQGIDPRVKLVCCLVLIVAGISSRSLVGLLLLLVMAVALARASHIPFARLLHQVWGGVLLFSGVIALPSLFIVPGTPLLSVPGLPWPITEQGLRSALFLVGRAETAATYSLLLILSTPWTHVLKALRSLGMPVVVVAVLGMTHRYLFVLLNLALQLQEARRSRIAARLSGRQRRSLAIASAGVLLARAFQLASDVHLAMLSRGYRGEVHILDQFRTRVRDWLSLGAVLAFATTVIWMGR